MAISEIEKVRAVFRGISDKNADLAIKYLDANRFLQHNPHAADGVDGLKQFIARFPREQLHMTVVRAFQDGRMSSPRRRARGPARTSSSISSASKTA